MVAPQSEEPVDYRVDPKKLIYRQPDRSPVPEGYYRQEVLPPVQCPAVLHKPFKKRYSLWTRLLDRIFDHGSLRDCIHDGDRCNQFLGHWEHKNQREHTNGWGDRWPVTAEDTRPYNPTEQRS